MFDADAAGGRFTTHGEVVVRQVKEMLEIMTDFETGNRYAVHAPDGSDLLFAAEEGSATAMVLRQVFKHGRPFTLLARDASGADVLRFRRPWTWWFSRLVVETPDGRVLGTVQQTFSLTGRHYALTDAADRPLGTLVGRLWRPWTFTLQRDGQTVGKVAKQFGGIATELFTDADTFGVQFDPAMNDAARTVLVGAAFLIDFVHFEDRE